MTSALPVKGFIYYLDELEADKQLITTFGLTATPYGFLHLSCDVNT